MWWVAYITKIRVMPFRPSSVGPNTPLLFPFLNAEVPCCYKTIRRSSGEEVTSCSSKLDNASTTLSVIPICSFCRFFFWRDSGLQSEDSHVQGLFSVLPSCNPCFSSPRNLAEAVVLLFAVTWFPFLPGHWLHSLRVIAGFFGPLREILGL
jgi:hypothetical protein